MITTTLLVDTEDKYVYENGSLPMRTLWDKELLTSVITNGLVSQGGYDTLPPSLQKLVTITHGEPTAPITIPEIDGLTDILLVTRVASKGQSGKRFRFNNFKCILKEERIEIWKRKV